MKKARRNEKVRRNEAIFNLYLKGYLVTHIAKIYKIVPDRVKQIIIRAALGVPSDGSTNNWGIVKKLLGKK